MTSNENSLNWFEISATDIGRAKTFYETIFSITMPQDKMMDMDMAFFPSEPGNGKASGCLCRSPYHTPSGDGVKLYLNGNPDLQPILSKVEAAGGSITMPKTKITDDIGYMAFFTDTEGNTIGLHSQQ